MTEKRRLKLLKKLNAVPAEELEKEKLKNQNMFYKVGVENSFGTLLYVQKCNGDKEVFDFIEQTEKDKKKGDTFEPSYVIQAYKDKNHTSFSECVCQYRISLA